MGYITGKFKGVLKISVSVLLIVFIFIGFTGKKGTQLLSATNMETAQAAEDGVKVTTHKNFIRAVYRMALERKDTGIFSYRGDYHDIFDGDINTLLQEVCAINDTETSDDFDYLANSISSVNVGTSYDYIGTEIIDSTITVKIQYLETAQQLKEVNVSVAQVLDSLGVRGKSNYKKVKLIHDYIVNNTRYIASRNSHTAYGALLEGQAVCQGYSLLVYKMLTEAGVKCRFISGKANNGQRTEDHAWNLVKIGKKWYYLDATWDDPTGGTDRLRYDYFLKGSENFEQDHLASSEFGKIIAKASKKDYKK